MEKKLLDKELGTVIIRRSARHKRYTLKVSDGIVIAIMPEQGDEHRLLSFIAEKKQKLLQMLSRQPARQVMDETTSMQTATFHLEIIRENRSKTLRPVLGGGVLRIYCPLDIRFEEEKVQSLLKEILTNVFRREAKRVLPDRLRELAEQFGFNYTDVRINNSKTRWGSCSGGKKINLSLSLMQLPWHLIDYVLLHELCHTVEMNHSDRFWALMDRVTANQAKKLRKELKQYHIL